MSLNKRMKKEYVEYLHNGVLLGCLKNNIIKFLGIWMELEKISSWVK